MKIKNKDLQKDKNQTKQKPTAGTSKGNLLENNCYRLSPAGKSLGSFTIRSK